MIRNAGHWLRAVHLSARDVRSPAAWKPLRCAGALRRPARCLAVIGAVSGCAAQESVRDPSEHAALPPALQDALETSESGQAVEWWNVHNGERGMVRPLRTYMSAAGIPCREYVLVAVHGNHGSETARAVACRDIDGVWKNGE